MILHCKMLVIHLQSILHHESINHRCKFALWNTNASGKKIKVFIFVILYIHSMLPWDMKLGEKENSITMLNQIDCRLNQRETRANIRRERKKINTQMYAESTIKHKNATRIEWKIEAEFQHSFFVGLGLGCHCKVATLNVYWFLYTQKIVRQCQRIWQCFGNRSQKKPPEKKTKIDKIVWKQSRNLLMKNICVRGKRAIWHSFVQHPFCYVRI